MSELPKEKTLEATPTWAVAVVCFVLVAISIAIELLIHHTESWLKKKKKAPLHEALEKIKAELMLLGFISLLLTILQDPLSNICVPRRVGHSWHPCRYTDTGKYYDPCLKKGQIQLVSAYGIHQLHIFIFFLAICHIAYCLVTYGLGKLKMRKWKSWEDATNTVEYQYYNDPERFRFARETSFGRRHLDFWSRSPILLWIGCFFRQFLRSVAKVDYLTLRHGFITEHLPPQSQASFNFQKYLNRSLERDFKVIVGISPVIWLSAVLYLLTNTNGWYSYFWLPFIPLIIIVLVGAKLQVIITKMGIRILERGDVIKGSPVVQPSDDLFWFGRPRFILFLIHFALFLNAFQIAFFAWSWYEFGYPSCYHENKEDMIIRISMGVLVQFICSYVTLPLYALVNQMGSKMRPVIFSDHVASALRGWHHTARKHVRQGRASGSSTPFSSRPASPLHGSTSPLYLLQGYKKSYDDGGYDETDVNNDVALATPGRDDVEEDFVRRDRLSEASVVIEIERDVEGPSSKDLGANLDAFSFRKRDNESL